MSVLTLKGKRINWSRPPKATDKVLWSNRDIYGRPVIGSLRAIAHLDWMNDRSWEKFGRPITVIQRMYNTGVDASAGTHDLDMTTDLRIDGVPWPDQSRFFRSHGHGGWVRTPPTFSFHWHGFTLPPREGRDVSDDFKSAGHEVGKYVDGGWSTYGRKVASSQIEDYYNHRTGLSGHAHDPSWYPSDIPATIFSLEEYIATRAPKPKTVAVSWNMDAGRPGPEVRRGLRNLIFRNRKPSIIALTEAGRYRSIIASVAKHRGYDAHHPAKSTAALMIRKGQRVRRSGVLKGSQPLPWAVVRVDGAWVLVMAVHMPEGRVRPGSYEVWDETCAGIESLVAEVGVKRVMLLGDWSTGWSVKDDRSPYALARRIGGYLARVKGIPTDFGIIRTVPLKAVKAAKRGSIHHSVRYVRK